MKQTLEEYIKSRITYLLGETEELEERIQSNQRQIKEDKKEIKSMGEEIQYLQNLKL